MPPDEIQQAEKEGRGILHAKTSKGVMTKSLDMIAETLRDQKHPFRKTDHLPKKPQKHRYERRKIKSYLHMGELLTEEPA